MLIALFALLPETAVHIFLWKFLLYSLGCVSLEKDYTIIIIGKDCTIITKRIEYIRVEFSQSLGMHFVSPFQPEREFKVYKSCKCSQIICSRVH